MKQKIVIQISLMNGNKSRKKAMQIAVEASGKQKLLVCFFNGGVETVSFTDEKSQLEVTGELDAALLTQLLRKKVGPADLLSVDPAGGEKKEDNKPKESEVAPYIYYNALPYYSAVPYYPVVDRDPSICSIL